MASREEIVTWATLQGFGTDVGYCVVSNFVAANGGRLPDSLTELCSWGTNVGMRTADGWVCGTAAPVGGLPSWDALYSQVAGWTSQHPLETGLIGLVAFGALLMRMGIVR